MESLPIDNLGVLGQFLTLKDILSLATSNKGFRENFTKPEINTQLANHFGFPYGLTLIQLKRYEEMSLEDRLVAAINMNDDRIIDFILSIGIHDYGKAIDAAIKNNRSRIVKKLIEHGNLDIKVLVSSAIMNENEHAVDMLLEQGKKDPIAYQSLLNDALLEVMYLSNIDFMKRLSQKLIELGANDLKGAIVHANFERGNEEIVNFIRSFM